MNTLPQEKAKELIDNFYKAYKYHNREYAKACALICVDEVIIYHPVATNDEPSKKFNEFWQQVKTEINNL